MKEVNFNVSLTDLSGKEIEPTQNMGKLVAQVLSNSNGKTPVKFWGWAKEFNAGQTLKITEDDLKLLRDFINDHEGLTALSKAQILEKL